MMKIEKNIVINSMKLAKSQNTSQETNITLFIPSIWSSVSLFLLAKKIYWSTNKFLGVRSPG